MFPVTLNFGSAGAGSSLVFDSLTSLSGGSFVNILNWSGMAGGDNGAPGNNRFLFVTNPGNTIDLSNFNFVGFGNGGLVIPYGNIFEIVPVPEPGTWAAGMLTLLAVGFTLRKKLGERRSLS
jgi:hypothetical protein